MRDGSASRRVAVVTGASSGIGEATARALGRRGWHVVLLARRRDRLERLAAELAGEFEVCDVGDREAVERAAAAILARHAEIKLLVNNAGVPGRTDFVTADAALVERVTRVNYLGGVWCLRAFLPALERARPSDVVNIVSAAGTVALPGSGPYAASKHAQLAFSRATAGQLRPRGVRVHTVKPGFVETEGFPQERLRRSPLLARTVIDADRVAEHILDVVDRDRVETFIPPWYRVGAIVAGVAPGLLTRLLATSLVRERAR